MILDNLILPSLFSFPLLFFVLPGSGSIWNLHSHDRLHPDQRNDSITRQFRSELPAVPHSWRQNVRQCLSHTHGWSGSHLLTLSCTSKSTNIMFMWMRVHRPGYCSVSPPRSCTQNQCYKAYRTMSRSCPRNQTLVQLDGNVATLENLFISYIIVIFTLTDAIGHSRLEDDLVLYCLSFLCPVVCSFQNQQRPLYWIKFTERHKTHFNHLNDGKSAVYGVLINVVILQIE